MQTPSFGYLIHLKCRNFLSHEGRIFRFEIHDKSKTKVQKGYNRIQNFIYNISVSINKAGDKLPYKSILNHISHKNFRIPTNYWYVITALTYKVHVLEYNIQIYFHFNKLILIEKIIYEKFYNWWKKQHTSNEHDLQSFIYWNFNDLK